MSYEAVPISPSRFAAALKDLPLSTLHLKAAELRNSIAHLDYSNEQLRPFAEGREGGSGPDQECADAIRENEVVVERMVQRMALLREEVEARGSSWLEFRMADDDDDVEKGEEWLVNGTGRGEGRGLDMDESGRGAEEGRSEAWRDGTFQTGRIVNGEVVMDRNTATDRPNGTGGSLDDEALTRAMEERMRALAEEEEGMHL